jgi:CRP/FNR family cyclic AMP-dependent transcriptional regulator
MPYIRRAFGILLGMKSPFNPAVYLEKAGVGRKIISLNDKETVFSQGDPGDSIFYIQSGRIRLGVISRSGKKAVIALFGTGDFCGEECITTPQLTRTVTACAITPCTLLKIDKERSDARAAPGAQLFQRLRCLFAGA